VVVTVLGIVAVAAGAHTVLIGGDSVLNHGDVSAGVDSELRFYAAWYVVAGALLLRAVRRIESISPSCRPRRRARDQRTGPSWAAEGGGPWDSWIA